MAFDLSVFNPGARPLMGLDVSSSAVKLVERYLPDPYIFVLLLTIIAALAA